jgi:hypothetical protein
LPVPFLLYLSEREMGECFRLDAKNHLLLVTILLEKPRDSDWRRKIHLSGHAKTLLY